MVDIARFFLTFTQSESCGKCVPCRLGTKRMLEILERITYGEGREQDIDLLAELADTIKTASMCGLGQTSPNPVLTTLRYFRDEYEAHVSEKRCPAKVCKSMISYRILADECIGCMLCARNCPVAAISGERRKVHVIDSQLCTRCDTCRQVCPVDAVVVE
jgi:ferredoxin